MRRTLPTSDRALAVAIKLATAELRVDALLGILKGANWRDQPRMPSGNPDGGQWTWMGPSSDDSTHVAAKEPRVRCRGFACQNGGWYEHSGMHYIDDKVLCPNCAIKYLGIQELPAVEVLRQRAMA